MPHDVIQPEGWAKAKGYANGVKTADNQLFIGGQIGWTADQVFETHDFIGQMEQALKNIVAVLEAAGGGSPTLKSLGGPPTHPLGKTLFTGSVHAGGVISGSDAGGLCGEDFAVGFALHRVVTGPVG